jgi:DNA mismatch repair protein MutS2
MRLSVKKDQVAPAQAAEDKISRQRQQSFLDKVKDISPELDLRGQYALDAITILDKYLEDAHLAGLDKARIIHGKGTGTLRKAVREHIKNHRYVEQFRDGLNQEGGYGVTIVELN